MGIELPQDIKDMAIPVHFDARGSSASVGPAFDTADVIRQQQIAENTRITEFNHGQMSKQGLGAVIKSGAVESILAARDASIKQEEKNKQDAIDTAILIASLNQRIAQLDGEIAQYESRFEARFGDAWREEIAVRVLDEDEMPERLDGESMSDYRERVEDAIVDKMIDPQTGKMKAEYRDHPEFKEYGEWAEREFERDKALALKQEIPNASPERLAEIDTEIREKYSVNQNRQLTQELASMDVVDESSKTILEATADAMDDNILEAETLEGDNLFGGMSPS